MPTPIDPDALEVINEQRHGEYGPSDTSDSASDVVGTEFEATDTDSNGTGERSSEESIPPSQTELDIETDDASDSDADVEVAEEVDRQLDRDRENARMDDPQHNTSKPT